MISQESKTTDNHETIKKWVKERYGKPAMVEGIMDEGKGGSMLRIYFPALVDESITCLTWDVFFKIFDENDLLFEYHEKTEDGELSKECRFIYKDER